MIRTIHIADYTPAWAEAFDDLSCVLKIALGELALGIEHVGSTSVPGLGAKPIIDLDVIIDTDLAVLCCRGAQQSWVLSRGRLGDTRKGCIRSRRSYSA